MNTRPHILYQNPSATITLLDIPRSIEVVQGDISGRLISTKPLEQPFPSLQPKSEKAKRNVGKASVDDLLIQRHLEFALEEIRQSHVGDWCLPRILDGEDDVLNQETRVRKKRKADLQSSEDVNLVTNRLRNCTILQDVSPTSIFHANALSIPAHIAAHNFFFSTPSIFHIPPNTTFLQAEIAPSRSQFILEAPDFNLILLDPPWPNRSARRKKSYQLSHDPESIEDLLNAVPVESKLTDGGYVGIWITNRARFRSMVLGEEEGLFARWGVRLVEEWVWVKVTRSGDPIYGLDSVWRRPWEVLLVGRKGGPCEDEEEGVKRRVIVGVPDLHSRKPNLKALFDQLLGKDVGKYEALEVFARNLTEGWWAWGNEALKFQSEEYWDSENTEYLDE